MFKRIFDGLEAIPLQTLVDKRVKHGDTVCLTDKTTIDEALRTLADKHILSAPVIDKDDKNLCLGMISVLNIASHVGRITVGDNAATDEQKIKSGTDLANTLVTECVDFNADDDYGVLLIPTDGSVSPSTAGSAAMIMGRAWRRIVVVDDQCNLVTTISQSDLIQEVDTMLKDDSMADLAALKVSDLGLKTAKPICLKFSDSVLDAVKKIADRNISAVGVVDDEGKLRESFEAADLRGLVSETITDVLLPIENFFEKYDKERLRGIGTVKMDDTLGEVVSRLAARNKHGLALHRLWIIDEQQQAKGVVSLTDIFKLIVGKKQ